MIYALTGASGFIGSAVAKRLIEDGHKVASIPHELLLDLNKLTEEMKRINPDYIIHMAAYGNHSTQTDEDQTFMSNVLGGFFLLKATKNIKYKGFINFSSSALQLPTETFYTATKASVEHLAKAFVEVYNKPIVTVRPSSVYGPGEADHRFIPTVIRKIKSGDTLTLDPLPRHDWLYVEDFVDGLSTVIDHIVDLKGNVVNISSNEQYSNKEVVAVLNKIAHKKAKTKYAKGMRTYDSSDWVVDNEELKIFGWSPQHPLEEGLRETYKLYTPHEN